MRNTRPTASVPLPQCWELIIALIQVIFLTFLIWRNAFTGLSLFWLNFLIFYIVWLSALMMLFAGFELARNMWDFVNQWVLIRLWLLSILVLLLEPRFVKMGRFWLRWNNFWGLSIELGLRNIKNSWVLFLMDDCIRFISFEILVKLAHIFNFESLVDFFRQITNLDLERARRLDNFSLIHVITSRHLIH